LADTNVSVKERRHEQRTEEFFIGDFGPYKYLSTLAPFALSLTDDPSGLQAFTTYKRLLELLEYVERIDRRQHEYAVANFYEYQ
jgi:hypothetical protein